MKLYLASRYSTKPQMEQYAAELREMGHEVTSTWLTEPHPPNTQLGDVNPRLLAGYAANDLADIRAADLMLFFSVEPTVPTLRGGRHVEFGYALGIEKPILVVGPHENIFHYLQNVRRVEEWKDAKMILGNFASILSPLAPSGS